MQVKLTIHFFNKLQYFDNKLRKKWFAVTEQFNKKKQGKRKKKKNKKKDKKRKKDREKELQVKQNSQTY